MNQKLLSFILIHKQTWSHKIIIYFYSLQVNFKEYLDKYPNIHIFKPYADF